VNSISLNDYNIYVGTESWAALATQLAAYPKIAVLVDENTERDCLPIFRANLPNLTFCTVRISAGEPHKNLDTCQLIWQQLFEHGLGRNAVLVNLGGGVIGDMGGFCASTYKRGIDFIQVPTTLLSQVDASIGGKLGIDFFEVKNSIGLFANPKAVYVNPIFLNTLPAREIRSGFAEILKHALIVDAQQWEKLVQIQDLAQVEWSELLLPSLNIKKTVVEADPFERGWRKALNFGHTIGHAVESLFLKTENPLLHGEAIAVGMICEAYLSNKKGSLSEKDLKEITLFILKIYGTIDLTCLEHSDLIALMQQDKKNDSNAINFTFLESIGKAKVNETATEKEILESLAFYRAFS
jgi:3-dehydroquinate synthase